ncbi:helix-turn-helix domain-containing protein [Clostridium botulinum]|uniref:helix-turn-helix domain-containing protein n=1 Tax=Clostridium botulinum TaxID=1491 RepID=UPI000D13CABB|nr:AraC family transcriptional regulator [Clostridium botulinum]AVQ45375.1 AraC family transcriptional regulator [Clostridium botulinum]AVQ49209.1 AraC family transcriptional regulator [Clostridium botulinum]
MAEIFCALDHVLLLADYNDPEKHKHWAKHLLISLKGNFNCLIEGEKISCEGIMISSNVFHTIESNGEDLLVYIFDETTDISKEIEEIYLKNRDYYILKSDIVEKIRTIWNHSMGKTSDSKKIEENYSNSYEKILNACNLKVKTPHIKDDRIKKVLKLLQDREEITDGTIAELAQIICLSQSRLSHLFKEETKISLNSFLVITKIAKTYEYIFAGENITEACIKAGFHSPSHFATTNKNMFGISANGFRKQVRFIQV